MKPKGKLLALFVVFGAIALVTASGAFTSTSVDRTMTIGVANDSSALLGLSPNSTSQNGDYASFTSNDQIQVDVSNANLDADTHINHVIVLQNNGNSDVDVWATLTGNNTGAVTLWSGPVGATEVPTTQDGTITLATGESISISIEIDTTDMGLSGGDSLVDTVTFHAATP